MHSLRRTAGEMLIREWPLAFSLVGLVGSCLLLGRIPRYNSTDLKVVYTLFVFLVLIKGLENSGCLRFLAAKAERGKHLSVKLILLTSVLAMFVTNDVAVITVVPLTLSLNVEHRERLIILQILAANAASALTPFGNPQNIFIYYYYHLHPWQFVRVILPLVVGTISVVLLLSLKDAQVDPAAPEAPRPSQEAYIYAGVFGVFVLAVLHIVPLTLGLLPVAYAILFDRQCMRIDCGLLATFLAFFGFTDNLMHALKISLDSAAQVFLASALTSQVVSNVPSALLFADFTRNWHALLWGVSVGGFGNLIGSLAGVIAYRLYAARYGRSAGFLLKFHIYGYAFFALGIVLYFLTVRLTGPV